MSTLELHPKLIYNGTFRIRTYEIDRKKRATVSALIQLMQEAAMQNVIELGLSVWDMEQNGISWVVMRMDIDFERLPMLGENIHIKTHGAGFDRLFTYRDYRVWDEHKNVLAQASSSWLLMDTIKRRMVRIPQEILAYKTPPPEECLERPARKIGKFNKADRSMTFRVDWHHLDFNEHLSNIFYIQWILEVLGEEILDQKHLKRLEILYKNECHLHDEVVAELEDLGEGKYMHRLIRKKDQLELLLAKTTWI